MEQRSLKYYPTFWQAVNLVVLYIFLQTLIDFPLALYDYQNGTDWLKEPWLKLPVFFGTTFIILLLGTRFSGLPYREIFPLKSFHWLIIPVVFLLLVSLQFFMNVITVHVEKTLPPPGWFLELFERIFESDFGIWGGVLRVVLLAPVIEELIFRGVIFSGFERNYSGFWAILFSSLLFALFHLNPWQLFPTFLLGLLVGYIRLRTGSLLAAIFTHALHNGMIFITVMNASYFNKLSWLNPGNEIYFAWHLIFLATCSAALYFITKRKTA